MKPHEIYREQRLKSWTRIDMLIALYDKCIEHVDVAINSQADELAMRSALLKAVNIVIHLRAGIDHDRGEFSQGIDRLLAFVEHRLLRETADDLNAAQSIMNTLRDAFGQVRDEAAELEATGEIPPLDDASTYVRGV